MNIFQKDIINIVYAALTNTKRKLSEDFDFEEAAKLAKKHSINALFYYGCVNCGISPDMTIMQEMFMNTCNHIMVSTNQMHSLEKLFSEFDAAEIEYMPLKGTLLKPLYPKPEMRAMGDADILIKVAQYSQIKPIMVRLGFEEAIENDHELGWIKSPVHIELHKRLIASYNKDYFAYFGDGWQLAKIKNGTRFSMTDEDQMIYLFTHFAKHYREAGIGIKHIVDLWVYRNAKPNLDEEYIKTELKKLQIVEFYNNIINTLDVWFENAPSTEITDFITNVIFNSGVYGTEQTHKVSTALMLADGKENTKGVKVKKAFLTLFLPYQYMCIVYPFLKKHAYLLPIMWLIRAVNALIFKRNSIKNNIQKIEKIDTDGAAEYKKQLNLVGLDFNFKE